MSSDNNVQNHSTASGRSELYEKRRNELVSMLNEALALNLPETYDAELRSTAKMCKENAFQIALVGEFQGGKSTTFNALCDGRDISPRGLGGGGIKTSAAAISAQNISGDETKNGLNEWAEVTFRHPGDLVLGMPILLRQTLFTDKAFAIEKTDDTKTEFLSNDGFCKYVKIDDKDHQAALKRAVDYLWGKWDENKSVFKDDVLDQLRIATLQLRFYGTSEYNELIKKNVLSVNDFQKLVAFPKDWAIRWGQGKNADFKLAEVAFVFVDSVLVRLHSKNLERIGCRITDCPGLFANAYDTKVAKKVIAESHGIWYLINGEKQIGEQDLKMIEELKNMGMLEKTDATFNIRESHEQKIKEIMPVTKGVLENKGYSLNVVPYNARLAFLSMQGNLLLNHSENFSDLDLKNMRIDARDKSGEDKPEKMWCKMVKRLSGLTELDSLEDIDELNSATVQIVRKESYIDDIMGKLEDEVINKKARGILIDKGSSRAAAALVDYEGVLQGKEQAAVDKEDEWKKKVCEAEKKLQEFVNKATTEVTESPLVAGKETLATKFADEFIDKVCDDEFISYVSSGICRILNSDFYLFENSAEEAVVAEGTPFLEESFKDSFTKTRTLVKTFYSFKDLERQSGALSKRIHKIWDEKQLSEERLFHGIAIPEINYADCLCGIDYLSDNIFSDNSVISEIAKAGAGIFKCLWSVISWALDCLSKFLRGVGEFFGLCDGSSGDESAGQAQKINRKVRSEIYNAIKNVDFRKKIAEPVAKSFIASIDKLTNDFNSSLTAMEAEFRDKRCKEPEENFKKSLSERKRIAEESNRIRTTQIEPLRNRINDFEKVVENEF